MGVHSAASHSQPQLGPWTGSLPDAASTERRVRDSEALDRAYRRRWPLLAGGFAITFLGWAGGLVAASPGAIITTFGLAALANIGVSGVQRRRRLGRWSVYVLALLDLGIVSLLVYFFGHGGMIAALLLAILPYAFEHGRRVGDVVVLLASLAYLAASAAHARVYGLTSPTLPAATYVEAVVFIVTAMALKHIPASLIERIRDVRSVMAEVERGDLSARAAGRHHDELGSLERSLNRMLDQIAATIAAVQREADEVAAYAEELAASAQELHATGEEANRTAVGVAGELRRQRGLAAEGRAESGKAAHQAETLRVRAEVMEADSERLLAAAERSRERVRRASTVLRAVGDEVRGTAHTVSALAAMSVRIGKFADTIARIARQTHLLALNAAIEAAQAEGAQGEGFAVVADEVRTLAAEAARSARDAAELISELRAEIGVVAQAMHLGEERVLDVGAVAEEADTALQELEEGVILVGDLVRATAQISRTQAQRLASLAEAMEQVATISRHASEGADATAAAAGTQIVSLADLSATSQQLAQLAERLRASIARFSVVGAAVTREHLVDSARYPQG